MLLAEGTKRNDTLSPKAKRALNTLSHLIFGAGIGYHYADYSLLGIEYTYENGNFYSFSFERIFGSPESREYAIEISYHNYFYFNDKIVYSNKYLIPYMITMDFKYYFAGLENLFFPFVKIGGFFPAAFEAGGGFSVRIYNNIFLNLSYTYLLHTVADIFPIFTSYGANLVTASFSYQLNFLRKKQ